MTGCCPAVCWPSPSTETIVAAYIVRITSKFLLWLHRSTNRRATLWVLIRISFPSRRAENIRRANTRARARGKRRDGRHGRACQQILIFISRGQAEPLRWRSPFQPPPVPGVVEPPRMRPSPRSFKRTSLLRMWPRRTKLMAMLRGMLLLDASIVALLSLLTAIKCPLWLHWVVGMVVPECALWISPLPVVFAAAAWFLRCRADVATDGVTSVRGGRQILTVATLALCGVAIILLLKPAAQAWWLGRSLPAQLDAAFAPIVASSPHPAPLAHPRRAPFSLAASL